MNLFLLVGYFWFNIHRSLLVQGYCAYQSFSWKMHQRCPIRVGEGFWTGR